MNIRLNFVNSAQFALTAAPRRRSLSSLKDYLMSAIKLTFRNNAQDITNTDVVLFQKNTDASVNHDVIAWKVIRQCAIGDVNSFPYPLTQQLSIVDPWGRYSALQDAGNGDVFSVGEPADQGGTVLTRTRERGNPNMITVRNDLAVGSIDIVMYKDGRQLSFKMGVAPGEESVFEMSPYIYIGTCAGVDEGDILDADTVSSSFTKLSLLGLKSADINMSGGGSGTRAAPLVFALANQKYA